MSGPKKSSWEIKQEIIAQRRAEKKAKREMQINNIREELDNCHRSLKILEQQYGNSVNHIKNSVNDWIKDIRSNINGDLRECFRGIKGIKNYLEKQKPILAQKEKKRQENEQKEVKINAIIDGLEEIKNDYAEIMNEGIVQRVELFKNSIKVNPDNQNTIEQIKQFKEKLFKLYEANTEIKENSKYVAESFANILKGNVKEENGNILISGAIDGVPISVKVNQVDNQIDFDTPLDGSCKTAMDSIQKELKNANIHLGEIKVVKTGQILNKYTKNSTGQKIKV